MSYKDFERAGPVEVRTRGPPFGSYKAEAGMKRSDLDRAHPVLGRRMSGESITRTRWTRRGRRSLWDWCVETVDGVFGLRWDVDAHRTRTRCLSWSDALVREEVPDSHHQWTIET